MYLAAQHKDGVDVREDSVKTEVDVWTDQRKNGGQDAGSRLQLWKKKRLISFAAHPVLIRHVENPLFPRGRGFSPMGFSPGSYSAHTKTHT